MLLTMVGVWLLGGAAIGLTFGEAFIGAAPVLSVLVIGVALESSASVLRKYLNSDPERGFRTSVVIVFGLVAILNVLLNLLWITDYGMMGAAWASVVSLGFSSLAVVWIVFMDQSRMRADPVEEVR